MGWIIAEAWDPTLPRGVADDWISSKFKGSFERAFIEERFRQINGFHGINTSWTKLLKKRAGIWEIRLKCAGKQIRMLAREGSDHRLVILESCVKKDEIPESCFTKANQRWAKIEKGELNVRDYPLDCG